MSSPPTDTERARALLDRIKAHGSPTLDLRAAHGARGQSGRILWANHEPFMIAEIVAFARELRGETPRPGPATADVDNEENPYS
ncbi:hypothetical protein DFR50_15911 [Roseiarcus fermentans]|uniref:Uncharacterized protein n=1 Tax=Roseiarcus fermentans TaxID=1473586 RepID=A0A366EGC4_9HYPH|nr:hypothetical protein [Roseiarcus fermentans]RBP01066.1 hypothetical protein DFR50_15911 [Roseiarcus fermentans]